MIWVWVGLISLGILLLYLETLRRAGTRGPWLAILSLTLPIFVGAFYLQSDGGLPTCPHLYSGSR